MATNFNDLINPFDPPAKPASKTSALRKAGDLAVGIGSGAVGATKALSDAFGADNAASKALGGVNEGLQGLLSPETVVRQYQQSRIMDEARGQGIGGQVAAGLKAFAVDPAQTIAQGAGSIAPFIAAQFVPGVGQSATAARALQLGMGAGMGAGTAKGAIFDEAKKRELAAGRTPDQAQAAADAAQSYGGANTDQIALGAGLGLADAALGATPAAVSALRRSLGKEAIEGIGKPTTDGIIKAGIKGAAGEMPVEFAQGAQEQVAANIAAQRAGYDAGTWDGAIAQGTLEGLAAAGPGAGFGILNRAKAPAAAPEQATGGTQPGQTTPTGSAGPTLDAPAADQAATATLGQSLTGTPMADLMGGGGMTGGANPLQAGLSTLTSNNQMYPGMNTEPAGYTVDPETGAIIPADPIGVRQMAEPAAQVEAPAPVAQAPVAPAPAPPALGESLTGTPVADMLDTRTPSQRMGLNPESGGLTAAAAIAVDSGASPATAGMGLRAPSGASPAAQPVAEQSTPQQQAQPPAQQPILNNGKPFTLAEVGKANQAIGGTAVSVPGGWAIQPPQAAQKPAATPATAMPTDATPAASAQSAILGRNSQPIAEGGQPFATREEAKAEKRMQPLMRVAPAEGGGFILKPASERQLAAVEKAAKRLKYPSTGETGPRSLHGFILQIGGLASGTMPDIGFDLNPRVGNRRLFPPRGKTIEQAAMAAKQEGYIQDEDENTLIEALKRSLNVSPVYTPDGYEAMAEAQMQARYEDFLAAEQDGGAENDWSHLTPEELADTGYNDYDEATQAEIRALVAQADALGVDAESILEDVAQRTENATQKDYENAAKSAIEAAIRSSEESRGRDLGQASTEAGPAAESTPAAPAAVTGQASDVRARNLAALKARMMGQKKPTPATPPAQTKASPAPEAGPTNQGATNGQGQETLLKAEQPTGADVSVSGAPVADTSLNRDSSWVIREKVTGKVVMETFDWAKVDALNTAKYEAVPIQRHLAEQGSKKPSDTTKPGGFTEKVRKKAGKVAPAPVAAQQTAGETLDANQKNSGGSLPSPIASKKTYSALLPFNIQGNKTQLLANGMDAFLRNAAKGARRVIDAFGGAAAYTHALAHNGDLPSGSVYNEFEPLRYIANKQIKENVEQVIARLEFHIGKINAMLATSEEATAKRKLTADYVINGINSHKQDGVPEHAKGLKNPPSNMDDSPDLAALYLIAQNSRFGYRPIQSDVGEDGKLRVMSDGENDLVSITKNGEKVTLFGRGKDKLINSASNLRAASKRLQGVDVRMGDGWMIGAKEASAGDVLLVDTSYLNKTDKNTGKTVETANYNKATQEDAIPDVYKEKVTENLLPAWDRGAKIVITNNWNDDVAAYLKNLGFTVIQDQRAKGVSNDTRELIAINFNQRTGAVDSRRGAVSGGSSRRSGKATDIGGNGSPGQDGLRGLAAGAEGQNGTVPRSGTGRLNPSTGAGKADARNAALTSVVRNGGNSTAVLTDIAKNSTNPAFKLVAKAILAKGLPFELRIRTDFTDGKVAHYSTDGHFVEFDPGMPFNLEQVLLHEAVHAVTSKYVASFGDSTPLGKELAALFKLAEQHAKKTGAEFYGLTNADEFLAEVMTNGAFAQWLDTVPVPLQKSALSRFVRAVARFFGIQKADGATAQAMDVFERIMLAQSDLQAEASQKLSTSKDATAVADAYGVDTEEDGGAVYFGDAEVMLNEEDSTYIVTSENEFTPDHRAAVAWAENNGFASEFAKGTPTKLSPVESMLRDALEATGDMGAAKDMAYEALRRHGVSVKWQEVVDTAKKMGRTVAFGSDDGLMFSRAAAKEVRDLVTLHNLSEDNLMYAGKMGGIPVPSIGITKVETPFGGFGGITLIAQKDLIDPESGVPVYDRDAWTARFPKLNFKKVKAKVADAFYERMQSVRDFGSDGGQFMSMLFEELRNSNVQAPDKITSLFTRYTAPKMLYAQEVLGKTIKPPMRDIKSETPFGHAKSWRDFVAKNYKAGMTEQQEKEFNRLAAVAARAAMAEINTENKARVDERTARMLDSSMNGYLDRYISEDYGMNAGILDRAVRDVKSFGKKEVDPMKLDEAVRKVVPTDDAGYNKWIANLVEPLFEAPTITLRGAEVPATLDNIVAAMTIGKTAGAEKSMTFGAGKAASMLGKQFKSIDEIKAARDRVVSTASESEGKKSTEALISEYQNHVSEFYTGKDWKGNIDTWAALDSSLEALTKAGRSPTDEAMKIALQRSGFKRVDAKGISLAKQALEALRDATTDYFEAKPQRAVRLNEFKGAVVPKGTSAEAIALLEENGITVEVHGNAEGAREKAIQKLAKKLDGKTGNVIFSRAKEQPLTQASTIRAAITNAYGNLLDKLEAKGLVTIAQTEREAIEAAAQARADKTGGDAEAIAGRMMSMAGLDVKYSANGNIEGFFDKQTGKSFLVADNLTAASAPGTLMHEVGIHMAAGGKLEPLFKRAGSILKSGSGNAFIQRVKARMARAGETSDEEAAAYIVTEYENDRAKAPITIGKWLADLTAAVRAWLFSKGIIPKAEQLTVADIAAVARANARSMARGGPNGGHGGGQAFSRTALPATLNIDGKDRPTTNSKGQPIHPTEEGVRNFWRWFSDSRVVDDLGRPMVVYHGTFSKEQINAFDVKKGNGMVWTTSQPSYASEFTGKESGAVYPLYASIKKPFDASKFTGEKSIKYWKQKLQSAGIDALKIDWSIVDFAPEYGSKYNFYDLFPHAGNNEAKSGALEAIQDAGFDGMIAPAEEGMSKKGGVNYVAFNPPQIKSATGNTGAFSPTDPDIRFSRAADMAGNAIDKAKQTADKAMGKDFPRAASMPDLNDDQRSLLGKVGASQSPASDAIKAATDRAGLKIRQGMVDRFAALKELDEKALGQNFIADSITNSAWVLAKMSSAGSGALNAMMKTGRIEMDAQQKVIGLKGAPNGGLTASLQKLGGPAEVERFFAWMAANRAEKLMGEGRENLFTPAEIAAGKTLNTGSTEGGKVRPALYSQVFSEFQQYRDDVLAIAEQTGIINSDNRAMWRDEFYVPFYRVMEDDADRGRSGGNGLSRQEAYKKLKGGKQNLNDLMENTLMNFHHLLSASLKNQAAVQAIKNAEHVGIARKVPEARRDTKTSTFVLVDGKKVFYEVDDPLVFESITTLADPGLNNTAVRVMGAFKRVFTNMTTATPQFIIANTFRDLLQASATSPTSKNIAKNLKEGIQSYRDEKTRAEMLASGGAFSFGHIYGMGADEVKASLQKTVAGAGLISSPSMIPSILRKGWDAWSNITDLSENASRAAAYTQNVGELGKLRAAFEARDVMDFSQHGAWPAVRLLVRIVPFLNARLQGLDKLYRSGLKPSILTAMGKGTDTDKQAAARFAMVTGALTLATMALYLVNADDDEYKKLEEWQKDTYWFIRIGENAFFLPKPFEVGAIATIAERTLQQAMDDKATGKLFRERMWDMLMQTFAFNPTPQMFQPLIDVYSNKDAFTGRDIESAGMERMSTGLRSRDTTTAPATALSAVSRVFGDESSIAVSPVQADHLIKGYLGGVGATAAGWIDTMYRAATGQSSPDKAWSEYQPIRRFYRDLDVPVANTRYATLFYDGLKEANRVYADVMELQKLGRTEEAEALAAEKRNPLQIRIALNAQQRRMTEINNRMKEVRRSDKDGEWKRRELDLLTTQKALITERMGKRIEDARVQ